MMRVLVTAVESRAVAACLCVQEVTSSRAAQVLRELCTSFIHLKHVLHHSR